MSVRVRFCPSPTGSPHVGFARAALYNWVFARHHGGTFVFRIEDTDKERSTQESYDAMLETMRWLGLDWDEGPEVGGPHGPYRQSERTDLYVDVLAKLSASSFTYDCFCTTAEVDARRKASGSKVQGYDGFCRDLSAEQRAAFEAEGRSPVVRFKMPDGPITWTDLVRGEITFESEHVPDFALCRANGDPLYTLVNPVDDALMKISHVLRGEDLMPSTPRQIALHRALIRIGVGERIPEYAHLPTVLGEGTKKLSKRDPQSNLLLHRDRGFLPEGLLNYLALLGWGIAEDRDVFTLGEMVRAFDVVDVNSNPARFDQKKADAINAEHIRRLEPAEFAARLRTFFDEHGYDTGLDEAGFATAADLVQTRVVVLSDAWNLLKFLNDGVYAIDPAAGAKELGPDAEGILDAACAALEALPEWSTPRIEEALKGALIDGLGLKPRKAFGPIRVAVTGATVSPPLFESLELLGSQRSLHRLREARDGCARNLW